MEIERKWLITEGKPYWINLGKATLISQGYLTTPDEDIEIRIRKKRIPTPHNNDAEYRLTAKSGEGLVRKETGFDITERAYSNLILQCEDRVIYKYRYTFGVEDRFAIWDSYLGGLGPRLNVVEIEFDTEEEANEFEAPDWFGEEVTDNPWYKNSHIANRQQP